MGYTPHVLVVGGGTTGAGVARDLAMRGLEVTLVEKGPLTSGATGSMHGLLHSGARYALSDPTSAEECLAENRVLRDVASHCVEEFGGLFVEHPSDPDGHFEKRREACETVGISTEELTGEEAREREPGLSPEIERAFSVPDAAIDPFRLTADLARSAAEHGAEIRTHTEVVDVHRADGAVSGVAVRDVDSADGDAGGADGSTTLVDLETVDADYVINAAGAWAGELAGMAGLDVEVRASKGAMTVTADRHVDTVVNRCRPRGQGDILVPHGDVSILGTTDVEVDHPEDYPEEGWEVDLLFEELEPVVPSLSDARTLRSYWGVRPLYEPPEDGDTDADGQADTTDLTRGFALLDHESRDGIWGMTTVVGGKLTTHRLMAERVADHVCGKFGIDRPCRTDEIPLPGSRESPEETAAALADLDVPAPTAEHTHERQGARAAEVLDAPEPNPVVCPCRQVTRAEVREALAEAGTAATDLDAVRRRTGVTTGDCQGAWCVHRVAAELHPEHGVEAVTRSLDALYQERWDGGRHALWGEQLGRAMDAYALHATTMNRDRPVDGADLSAFDAGPTAGGGGDGESGDGESGDSDASGDGDAVATDGGPAGGDGGGGDAAGGGRR